MIGWMKLILPDYRAEEARQILEQLLVCSARSVMGFVLIVYLWLEVNVAYLNGLTVMQK